MKTYQTKCSTKTLINDEKIDTYTDDMFMVQTRLPSRSNNPPSSKQKSLYLLNEKLNLNINNYKIRPQTNWVPDQKSIKIGKRLDLRSSGNDFRTTKNSFSSRNKTSRAQTTRCIMINPSAATYRDHMMEDLEETIDNMQQSVNDYKQKNSKNLYNKI